MRGGARCLQQRRRQYPRHRASLTAQAPGSKAPSAPGYQHRGQRAVKYGIRAYVLDKQPPFLAMQAPRGVGPVDGGGFPHLLLDRLP